MLIDINPKAEGLDKVLKPWQQKVFRYLWKAYEKKNNPEYKGETTLAIYKNVQLLLQSDKDSRNSISRASVINFCKAMEREGYLDVYYGTGKGGERGYYKPNRRARDEHVFVETVIETIFISFQEEYAQELANVVSEHFG